MDKLLQSINGVVWGVPALVLILGVGLAYSFATNFAQIRLFPQALKTFFGKLFKKKSGEVSAFQALCTALAATVGTGNIAGVAGAIAIGGPGAIFWMWVSAVIGMITKFAEAVLAVKFRVRQKDGYAGGPMYYIQNGLHKRWHWLGAIYCVFGIVAAFGMGNATQINAVIGGIHSALTALEIGYSFRLDLLIGVAASVSVTVLLLGGARRVGKFAEMLVPFTSVAYILLCLGVLALRCRALPQAFNSILLGAFSPRAVTGGLVGSAFSALRIGVSRGVFTNEAGMGTAAIAHAGAAVKHPAEQGYMGMMEVFLDTIVICTLTALAILCCDAQILYGVDEGAVLTARAFSSVYGPWANVALALFLCVFAFATMLGWGLYGVRCAQYLFGESRWKLFVFLQAITITGSVFLKTGTVWMLSETVNGLMAIPNLIALWLLMPVTVKAIYEKGAS